MFPHQRRRNHIKLFERNYAINPDFAAKKGQQVDEQRWTGIVWNSNQIVKTLARPVFPEHLLFRNQDHVTPVSFALVNEIGAFEVGG